MPGVDRGSGQRAREHGLAGARWSDEQDVAGVVEEPQRAQLPDQLLIDPGLGGEVELVDRPGRGQTGEPEPAGEPAGLGELDLDAQQPLERGHRRQLLGPGGVQDAGERLGAGAQLQHLQMAA
jgi:hypothetical protein